MVHVLGESEYASLMSPIGNIGLAKLGPFLASGFSQVAGNNP